MKKTFSLILALLFALGVLTSCNVSSDYNNEFVGKMPQNASLPMKGSACSFSANVYSVSENDFRANRIMIETYNNISPINALVSTLLSQKSLSHLTNKLSVSDVLVSSDICILNLTGKAPADEKDYFVLEALIMNTLHDFCSCNTLCILINGKMPEINGIPYGTAHYQANTTPDEYITQRTEVLTSKDESSFSGADVIFFLLYDDSDLVYPRAVSESIFKFSDNPAQHAKKLLSAYSEAYTRYINRTQQKSYSECFSISLATSENNSYKIRVKLNDGYEADKEQLKKAVCLTLICNMYNVEKTEISLDGAPVSFKNEELFNYVGTLYGFYYPLRNISTLEIKQICIPAADTFTPSAILEYMFHPESTALTLFPQFLGGKLKIEYWAENTAVIIFDDEAFEEMKEKYIISSPFYDSAETRERLFVYSVVNTLTQLPNIDRVLFTNNNKEPYKNLLNIYLGSPLYANPGLNAD